MSATAEIDSLKRRLDELRPMSSKTLAQLEQHYDVQLTYTSNAIEGNALTYGETAMIIEKGITVGGKSINDHLEALDLYEATRFIRRAVADKTSTDEAFVVGLHARIVARSRPDIAGRYADVRRRIAGSDVIFPNPAKIPELMAHLGRTISAATQTADEAFKAHLDLVTIHPFVDGNGRTARLLMNTMLIARGYPPIAIRPEDRSEYINGIEKAQLGGSTAAYVALMSIRLTDTMREYVAAIEEAVTRAPEHHGDV